VAFDQGFYSPALIINVISISLFRIICKDNRLRRFVGRFGGAVSLPAAVEIRPVLSV
jgi:hypothetical protein